jgi:mannose-6-phosphate isomerase-like protein (cupin superfamily)
MSADLKLLERQLHDEGFLHTYVWQDGPNTSYPDHTHASETAHIVLDGEMTLTQGGSTKAFGVGERCDILAGTVHSAKMGPRGCRYLIGEK